MTPDEEQRLREVQVTARRIYPGRDWNQLSAQEQKAVYQSYDAMRAQAASAYTTPLPQGRQAGGIFTASNPLETLGAVAQQAAGAYGLRQLNQQESQGRRAMADLVTRRDALDRESEYANQQREEERRRQFLQSIFQRGAY